MPISPAEYAAMAKRYAPPSTLGKDCLNAFLCGGGICALAQLLPDRDPERPFFSAPSSGT